MEPEEFRALRERAEKNAAQRDAAIAALRDLLACVDRRAQMPHETQLVVWRAEAVLEEMGR